MRIQLPQNGQPIDYNYFSKMIDAINSIAEKITQSRVNDSTVKTQELQMAAQYKGIVSNEKVEAGTVKDFVVDFGIKFKTPPIVTITPQRSGTKTEASRQVIVVIDSISESSVSGKITFIGTSNGAATIGLNIVAVGNPAITGG
jgi:hypothetical protein